MTLDEMEELVMVRGRELLRLVQLGAGRAGGRESGWRGWTGADGVPRTRAERGHGRAVVTGWVRSRCGGSATGAGIRGRT